MMQKKDLITLLNLTTLKKILPTTTNKEKSKEIEKTSLNMFNLYKHKPSFLMIKDNKRKDKGRGGGQVPIPKFWQVSYTNLIQFL